MPTIRRAARQARDFNQIECETQEELDHYWDHLSASGPPEAQMCGWLKDKSGVS